jgi:hypothetical protein
MESVATHIQELVSKAGDLAETKVEIWKLKAAGKISETVSSLISVAAIVLLVSASVFLLSVGAAYWIGQRLGSTAYGFLVIGGFYALAGLLIYVFRKSWIQKPVSNLVIGKIVKES